MKHRLTTKKVIELIEKLEIFIDRLAVIPATEFYRSKILLGLLSKSFTTSRAICALVDAGFAGDAFGLSRTLIEIFLTTRYLTNDENQTEARAKLYFEYIAKTQDEILRLTGKFFPEIRLDLSGRSEMDELSKNYESSHSWSNIRGSIKAMAMEKDTYEVDGLGEPITHAFDYEFIYWQTSFYVHATIHSLMPHLSDKGEPFRVRANQFSDSIRVDQAVFNALSFPAKTVVCAFRGLRAAPPEILLKEIHAAMLKDARSSKAAD